MFKIVYALHFSIFSHLQELTVDRDEIMRQKQALLKTVKDKDDDIKRLGLQASSILIFFFVLFGLFVWVTSVCSYPYQVSGHTYFPSFIALIFLSSFSSPQLTRQSVVSPGSDDAEARVRTLTDNLLQKQVGDLEIYVCMHTHIHTCEKHTFIRSHTHSLTHSFAHSQLTDALARPAIIENLLSTYSLAHKPTRSLTYSLAFPL